MKTNIEKTVTADHVLAAARKAEAAYAQLRDAVRELASAANQELARRKRAGVNTETALTTAKRIRHMRNQVYNLSSPNGSWTGPNYTEAAKTMLATWTA